MVSISPAYNFPGVVFMTSVVMEEFLPAAFGPPWVWDTESTRNLFGLKIVLGMIHVLWAKIWANICFNDDRQ